LNGGLTMRIKAILCPVDRSEVSDRAMTYATALAREYVARLSVLEVIDWRMPPMVGALELPAMPPEVQTAALGHLHRLASPARELGIPTEVGVDVGPVVRRILERASIVAADLIVVGTHGRGGFDRLALGSVAEHVLRMAECPVLTVPPHAVPPPTDPLFRMIVCAVDFSPVSADVLRIGADLARRHGGRLLVAHVVDWPFARTSGHETAVNFKTTLETRAHEDLSSLLAGEAAPPSNVASIVLTGTPRDEILACARNRHADLIVLGVSGHGAVERALLGSTAHGVVRHSECPVLTVRMSSEPRQRSEA
jgi:nucleotide-binding universal stress UspA family protein